MSSIVDVINHYQTSINKSLNDTARIVHCIGKLYKLPISVRHLQDTGIGRTVNSLRKYDGEVGVAAKALVTKWKAMVAAEESDDNTGAAGSHGEGADSDGRATEERQHRSDMSDQEEDDGTDRRHDRRSTAEDDDNDDDDDDEEDEDDDDRTSHNRDQNESYEEPTLRVDEEYREEAERTNSDSNGDESDGQTGVTQPEVHHVFHIREAEPDHELRSEHKTATSEWGEHHTSSKRHSSGSSSRNHHHSSSSKSTGSSGSGDKHKNHSSSSSSSSRHKNESDHHRHSSSGGESKSHKSSSSRADHHGSSKRSSSSHGDGGERHKERSSSKHHSSGSNTSEPVGSSGSINNVSISSSSTSSNGNSSHARKESSHKESRHRSKEEHSGSSKRHASDEADTERDSSASSSKRSRKEHRTDRTDSSTTPSSSHAATSSSHSKKDKSKGHSSSSASSSSSKRREHGESKSDTTRERSDEARSKSKRKEKASSSPAEGQEQNNDDSAGEDRNGASFSDLLAMMDAPSGSKKKSHSSGSKEKVKVTVTKSSSSSSSARGDGQAPSHSRSKPEQPRPSVSTAAGRNGGIPTATDLLSQNVKLEPLPEASEIVESLPMISPNYRPMPLNQTVMDCVFMGGQGGRGKGRPLTEEEALGQSMQSKNMRTKVYSGQKTASKGIIPTLYELCIRLLQDHIDEIGATGGIPFYILKPVLERANPTQLLNLEHFNPHFVEDSDVLWELHCKRTFRSKQRNEEELETWREMFLRCSEERDAKLRSLTQNIKLSQEQAAAPIRKTQLAYVDTAVKPPRSVISKQVKYGTARAPVVSPAARVAALKAGNVTQAGDTRLRVAAGVRDNAQAQVFQPQKPRKAPMMAKVLSSMKGFKTSFRR